METQKSKADTLVLQSEFRQKTTKGLKTQNKHLLGWVDQVENHLLTLKKQNSTLVEQHKRHTSVFKGVETIVLTNSREIY